MKLYLGGGRNPGEIPPMRENVKSILIKEQVKNLLHITFALAGIHGKSNDRCLPKEFKPLSDELRINYFDGTYREEIIAAPYETMYINGGHYRDFLFKNAKKEELFDKIRNSELIIAESSGAMILGEYTLNEQKTGFEKGLGLVKDTIICPHFSTNYNKPELQQLFKDAAEEYQCNILGIDETTFVGYEDGNYGEKIGTGNFYQL